MNKRKEKQMIQTSCSELLVDTQIHDPAEALRKISALMEACNWESSPPLTLKLLKSLKEGVREYSGQDHSPEIVVYDKEGNRAWLEYGPNGYLDFLGYRFDSHCNQGDSACFPIFDKAIEVLQGQLIACDGGSTEIFNDWKAGIIEGESRELPNNLLE